MSIQESKPKTQWLRSKIQEINPLEKTIIVNGNDET